MKSIALLPLAALALLPLVVPRSLAAPDPLAPERDLATLVPADCPLYLEAPGLAELARAGASHPLARAVLGEPHLRAAFGAGDPEAWLAERISALDAQVGLPVLPAIADLSERGAALAVTSRDGRARYLMLLRGKDPELVAKTVQRALDLAAEKSGYPGALSKSTATIAGADVWRIGDDFTVARLDALVAVSDDGELARAALELAGDQRARGLLGRPGFEAAAASRSSKALAWLYADLGALESAPELLQDGGEGLKQLRAMAANPAVQLLLGPGFAAAGRAKTVSLLALCSGEDLELELSAQGVDAGASRALFPTASEEAPAELDPRANAAEVLVYRDLADIFAKRAELFPPETLPGFAEATSNLALLFGGQDVGESIWPELSPWMWLVAREVEFDAGAVPEIALPAAALCVRVKDPERMGAAFTGAFQTTLGFVNIERAQQMHPPMVVRVEAQDGAQITYAKLLPPKPGTGVDIGYNLEPACAMVGDTFVIGTHYKLVRALARELAAHPAGRVPGGESLRVSGKAVAGALAANREALVMNGMLSEGKTREDAQRDVELLIGACDAVERASFAVRYAAGDEIELALELDLRAPKE